MGGPANGQRPHRKRGVVAAAAVVAIFALLAAMAAFVLLNVGDSVPSRQTAGAPAPKMSAPEEPSTRSGDDEIASSAGEPEASVEAPAEAAPSPELESLQPAPVPPAPAAANGGSDPKFAIMRVFYATDRKRTGSAAPNEMYGGDRGTLVYGAAEVSIPREHRLGQLEGPSIWRLEFRETPESHVVLMTAVEQLPDQYYAEIAARVAGSSGKSAFIFVHGYNVLFKDAARRTAQMAYDLGFSGAPVFYSWPSQGTMAGYKFDESNVVWTQANLKRFIKEFTERSSAESIYLVAHSMGNRALTGAIKELMQESPDVRRKIREIIMAAPDIDAEVFKRDIAPFIVTATPSVTLYASSNDKALQASQEVNGYARAGDSGGGITVVPGIDTIDSTDAETDFVGHSYYAESKSIISDIFNLIRLGQRPDQRPGLKPTDGTSGHYWKFVRQP